MSLFYIFTGPTLSLPVTLTNPFSSNSKPSLYILGLARPPPFNNLCLIQRCLQGAVDESFPSSTVQVEPLNISALAFCQDLVVTLAASLLDHGKQ